MKRDNSFTLLSSRTLYYGDMAFDELYKYLPVDDQTHRIMDIDTIEQYSRSGAYIVMAEQVNESQEVLIVDFVDFFDPSNSVNLIE